MGDRQKPSVQGDGTASHGRPRRCVRAAIVAVAMVCGVVLLGSLRRLHDGDRPPDPWQAASFAAMEAEVSANAAGSPEAAVALRLEGIALVRGLVERCPDSPDAIDVAATLYKKFGLAEKAAACWEQCLALDPDFGEAHYQLGMLARDRDDHAAAAGHFRKAIELKTSVPGIADSLAWSLIDLERPAEAVEVLKQELRARPNSMATRMLLGRAYLRIKDYPKAKQNFEAAIAVAPDLMFAYPGAATACAKLGEKEKAARYARRYTTLRAKKEQDDRLRKRDPVRDARQVTAFVATLAGKAYYAQGDAQTARGIWHRAAELWPEDAQPALLLAWSYGQEGRLEEAIRTLAAARDSRPDDLEIPLQLARLYAERGRWKEAEATLRGAIRRVPKRAEAYSALADLLLGRGQDAAEARRLADKATQLDPIPLNHSLVAVACWRCGDRAGALAAIERALAADPENPRYRQLASAIRGGPSPGAAAGPRAHRD